MLEMALMDVAWGMSKAYVETFAQLIRVGYGVAS